jgi:hypothetical protein
MNGRRALAIVPAAFMVIGILVIQTHSPRRRILLVPLSSLRRMRLSHQTSGPKG